MGINAAVCNSHVRLVSGGSYIPALVGAQQAAGALVPGNSLLALVPASESSPTLPLAFVADARPKIDFTVEIYLKSTIVPVVNSNILLGFASLAVRITIICKTGYISITWLCAGCAVWHRMPAATVGFEAALLLSCGKLYPALQWSVRPVALLARGELPYCAGFACCCVMPA